VVIPIGFLTTTIVFVPRLIEIPADPMGSVTVLIGYMSPPLGYCVTLVADYAIFRSFEGD
jgi:hypothetical protein